MLSPLHLIARIDPPHGTSNLKNICEGWGDGGRKVSTPPSASFTYVFYNSLFGVASDKHQFLGRSIPV